MAYVCNVIEHKEAEFREKTVNEGVALLRRKAVLETLKILSTPSLSEE